MVRSGRIGKVHTVRIGLPSDPSGGSIEVIPVPSNLNYDMWLGSTPLAPYTVDRVHSQGATVKERYAQRPGWLRMEEYYLGMITVWGSHHVDIAHWGIGTEHTGPTSIEAKAASALQAITRTFSKPRLARTTCVCTKGSLPLAPDPTAARNEACLCAVTATAGSPLDLTGNRRRLLERATLALGRLDSVSTLLSPIPALRIDHPD